MTKKHQIVFRQGKATKDLISILDGYRDGVCTVTIEEGEPKKRSLDANALQAVWIKQISDYSGIDILGVRRYLKLEFGLPILLYDTETEAEKEAAIKTKWTLDKIGFEHLPYEKRLKLSDIFSVTSILSRRQHKNFMEQIQAHYTPNLILE